MMDLPEIAQSTGHLRQELERFDDFHRSLLGMVDVFDTVEDDLDLDDRDVWQDDVVGQTRELVNEMERLIEAVDDLYQDMIDKIGRNRL